MAKQKNNKNTIPVEQLEAEYKTIAPIAERFCAELTNQIRPCTNIWPSAQDVGVNARLNLNIKW